MTEQTEAYVVAATCFVAGGLIILARNWFAQGFMDMLRGFKTDRTSEGMKRFTSTGMANFGAAVIVISILIAAGVY